jgi:hypothetical protein
MLVDAVCGWKSVFEDASKKHKKWLRIYRHLKPSFIIYFLTNLIYIQFTQLFY